MYDTDSLYVHLSLSAGLPAPSALPSVLSVRSTVLVQAASGSHMFSKESIVCAMCVRVCVCVCLSVCVVCVSVCAVYVCLGMYV